MIKCEKPKSCIPTTLNASQFKQSAQGSMLPHGLLLIVVKKKFKMWCNIKIEKWSLYTLISHFIK